MQIKLRKKDILKIIQEVFDSDEQIKKQVDFDAFTKLYFNQIIKRLKDVNGIYKFTREKYQTAIRVYFYYSQEKNIYNILLLAMIEKRLFDDRSD